MTIVQPTEENLQRAADLIRAGEVVAFPTETVYGLGADATNEAAVQKIYAIKGRPAFNPLIAHFADEKEIASHLTALSEVQHTFFEKLATFWPGPLSLVLPYRNQGDSAICSAARAGKDSCAVRVPAHPIARRLIELSGRPIAAPSANPSSYISPTTAQHVEAQLGSKVALILDGGQCTVGVESTILSLLSTPPTLLRAGGISLEDLERDIGAVVLSGGASTHKQAPLAPGMLAEHYSPRTKLIFIEQFLLLAQKPSKVALLSCNSSKLQHLFPFSHIRELSPKNDMQEAAHNLFAVLHELDSAQVELIVVEPCEQTGLGMAVIDRLMRASKRHA